MLDLRMIDSLDLPELDPYRTMKRPDAHEQVGIFVAEGDKVVRRLLTHPEIPIISMLLPPVWLDTLRPVIEARSELIRVFVAEKRVLEKLTGYSLYQGVLALAKVPTSPHFDQLLQMAARPRLLLAVDGVNNAENLGVIVRNGVGLGAQIMIVGETSSSPYLRRAVRSSMGAVFKLGVAHVAHLPHTLRKLRAQGIRCLAAHPSSIERPLYDTDLTGDVCLVLGHEGLGISPDVLEACDDSIAIPMQRGQDSLNVGSAAAIFLYEIQRQRTQSRAKEPSPPAVGERA